MELVQAGACSHLAKPFSATELATTLDKIAAELKQQRALLRPGDQELGMGELIGASAPMKQVFGLAA